jgi:hypothetical protein
MEVETTSDKMENKKGGIELDSIVTQMQRKWLRIQGRLRRRKLEKKHQVHKKICYFNLF